MANQVDNDVHIRGSVYYKKRPNIVPEPRGPLLGAEKIKRVDFKFKPTIVGSVRTTLTHSEIMKSVVKL